MDTGGTDPPILNFGTRCFVSMTPWPLYPLNKCARYPMNGLHAQIWSELCSKDKIGNPPEK